jgi:hypothetical protein
LAFHASPQSGFDAARKKAQGSRVTDGKDPSPSTSRPWTLVAGNGKEKVHVARQLA